MKIALIQSSLLWENPKANRNHFEEKINALLTEIAKEELLVETLETRWSDNLDFYDVSVWGIKRALERAYEAGRQSVK